MKIKSIICALSVTAISAFAGDAPPSAKSAADKIVAALNSGDYAAFISDGDTAFQKLKKDQFDSVVKQLSPRFKSGYEVTYLGEMKQKGFEVSLWKFTFKDGGDDMLGTLSLKEGKVGGFWIK
jgi:flavodoxin